MKEFWLVDAGNTKIKFAQYKAGQITDVNSIATGDQVKQVILYRNIFSKSTLPIALSSVVPKVTEAFVKEAAVVNRSLYCVRPLEQDLISGVNKEMGADRVCEAVAAWQIYGGGKKPVIVMGFGTATTLLTIEADGKVGGGFIGPGLGSMLEVMHIKTALLPLLDIEGAKAELGVDTQSHMKNGALLGQIGLMKEWLSVARASLGSDAVSICTGGFDHVLSGFAQLFDFTDDMLTLKGLTILAERQQVF